MPKILRLSKRKKDSTNKRTLVVSILFFSGLLSYGQKNQVCFTIDDLPVVGLSSRSNESQRTVVKKLLLALKKHKIPAIGFVNEFKLYTAGQQDTFKINLLKMWLDSGMNLGNHSFSHMDYHHVNCTEYFNDIIKGEKLTKPLMNSYGKSCRYFRHPYLHIGESREKADSLHAFLINTGYTEAPVTIDNADWIFSLAYDSARLKGDMALLKSIGTTYIDYMQKKLKYYKTQSIKLFGRNIRHILLIHSNAINADYLDELAVMYEKNNYEFISLEKALEDKAYLTKVTLYRNWGISWLDRWALSIGKKGKYFDDEPATPGYIMKLAKTTRE
ncbi:MAG: polysaccharide deacetylase family protein [Ferruginibacter sp.]